MEWELTAVRPCEARRWLGQNRVVLELQLQLIWMPGTEQLTLPSQSCGEQQTKGAEVWLAAGLQLKSMLTSSGANNDEERVYRVNVPFLAGARNPSRSSDVADVSLPSLSQSSGRNNVELHPPAFRRLGVGSDSDADVAAAGPTPSKLAAAAARRNRQDAHAKGWTDSRQPLLSWAISFEQSRGIRWSPPPPPLPPAPARLWSEPLKLAGAKPQAGLFVTVDGRKWAIVANVTGNGNLRLKWFDDGSDYDVKHDGLKLGLVRPSDCIVALADRSEIPEAGVTITADDIVAEKPAEFYDWTLTRQKRWFKTMEESHDQKASEAEGTDALNSVDEAEEPLFGEEEEAGMAKAKREFLQQNQSEYDSLIADKDAVNVVAKERAVIARRGCIRGRCCSCLMRKNRQVAVAYQST
eukprot:SAG31_NODE_4963_length_2833_cov_1.932699_3_plen_410_part_00